MATNKGAIGFLWQQFGDYHMDRCEAAGRAFASERRVFGIEVASRSDTYKWQETGPGEHFTKVTLFPGRKAERIGTWQVLFALVGAIRRCGIRELFIAGYELPPVILLSLIAWTLGVRLYVQLDSKFDDKPRRLSREIGKRLLLLPYRGGLASGRRAADYLRFLGLKRRPVALGYDSVSLDRLRSLVAGPAPAWEERSFLVIARFVPKKNLSLALLAYAGYCAEGGAPPRRLRLCGSGPLEASLRQQAETLGIADRVDFLGFQTQAGVAAELAAALCLLLPSTEEQWGLVVNETLAFGLPLIVSTATGAADLLVGTHSNGFILDPSDAAAWSAAMIQVGRDKMLWGRMSEVSTNRAALGDVAAFVAGVRNVLAGPSPFPQRADTVPVDPVRPS